MSDRRRHPDKDVEAAVALAEAHGWRLEFGRNHAWGRLYCPLADRSGCILFVWSTPKNPGNHARSLIRLIEKCPHGDHDE